MQPNYVEKYLCTEKYWKNEPQNINGLLAWVIRLTAIFIFFCILFSIFQNIYHWYTFLMLLEHTIPYDTGRHFYIITLPYLLVLL